MCETIVFAIYINYKLHFNPHSPSLCGPMPLYKPDVPEADYEQTTSRDPERARDRFTSSDSAGSTSSTSSGRSDDPSLLPSPPVQAGKGIYAEVDPVKQTRVQPPAKEEPVFYSQIKRQD